MKDEGEGVVPAREVEDALERAQGRLEEVNEIAALAVVQSRIIRYRNINYCDLK